MNESILNHAAHCYGLKTAQQVGCVLNAPFSIILYNLHMPEYRRSYIEGGTYFFTVVTYNRRPILTSTEATAGRVRSQRTVFDYPI